MLSQNTIDYSQTLTSDADIPGQTQITTNSGDRGQKLQNRNCDLHPELLCPEPLDKTSVYKQVDPSGTSLHTNAGESNNYNYVQERTVWPRYQVQSRSRPQRTVSSQGLHDATSDNQEIARSDTDLITGMRFKKRDIPGHKGMALLPHGVNLANIGKGVFPGTVRKQS